MVHGALVHECMSAFNIYHIFGLRSQYNMPQNRTHQKRSAEEGEGEVWRGGGRREGARESE